ncbi:transposase [Chryseobacterium glaciei]|uniref:Transposase n=1 Tax=Chryseobacterium glaciei TaxID=1685010 RepID=A0A172XQC1_9FLAO|nr:transposase [Chryseobacterium glaciei]ANF49116.1 transposase [Chryseobacterium glaciei]
MDNIIKNIHIGNLIHQRVKEDQTELSRICNFMQCTEEEAEKMYQSKTIDTEVLLRWSKLLKYDFFRIYSQHLIMYSPPSSVDYNKTKAGKTSILPRFRKNIYTKEMIDFILEMIEKEEKTKNQVMQEYGIPKTTLYKWIHKFSRL